MVSSVRKWVKMYQAKPKAMPAARRRFDGIAKKAVL
jgi:hypothetical protein